MLDSLTKGIGLERFVLSVIASNQFKTFFTSARDSIVLVASDKDLFSLVLLILLRRYLANLFFASALADNFRLHLHLVEPTTSCIFFSGSDYLFVIRQWCAQINCVFVASVIDKLWLMLCKLLGYTPRSYIKVAPCYN